MYSNSLYMYMIKIQVLYWYESNTFSQNFVPPPELYDTLHVHVTIHYTICTLAPPEGVWLTSLTSPGTCSRPLY